MQHAGYQDFLLSSRELKALADVEGAEWRAFVMAWWAAHNSGLVTVKVLCDLAARGELLGTVVRGDATEHSQRLKLAAALRKMRDRVFAVGDQIVKLESKLNGNTKNNEHRLVTVPA